MLIRVNEHYTAWQGTGALQGERQYLIRFAGCSVRCPIRSECDQQDALKFGQGEMIELSHLVDIARESVGKAGWVHITGGEPCDSPVQLRELTALCVKNDLRVHIQTSGTRSVNCHYDWLTVSPKSAVFELKQSSGSEIVCVYDSRQYIDVGVFRSYYTFTRFMHYYIVPFDVGGIANVEQTVEMADKLRIAGMQWRLGLQAHKVWGVK